MNDATRKLLEKAQRAVKTADKVLAIGEVEDAAARAYYAMFYVAEALLAERGLSFRKHSGVHSAFGMHFAKTGLLDAKFHRWLLAGFGKRIAADYGIDEALVDEDAREMIDHARAFLDEARRFVGRTS
ncbi:MAG: HEPN domain-containing protein [Pseudomonadota bacterium]